MSLNEWTLLTGPMLMASDELSRIHNTDSRKRPGC